MSRLRCLPIVWFLAAVVGAGAVLRAQQPADGPDRPAGSVDAVEVVLRDAILRARDRGRALAAAALDRAAGETLLVAGAPVPPGLPAQRVAERAAERDAALAALAARIEASDGERAAWVARVVAALDDERDARRFVAAARAAAGLGLSEALEPLGRGLEPERPDVVRAAASDALVQLTGRRLLAPADLAAFRRTLRGEPLGAHWREPLQRARTEGRARLLAWIEAEPERALEHLGDPDPETRAAVASLVARLVADKRLDPDACLRALLESLSAETDPHAFAAQLDAALAPLTGEPATAPLVRELRSRLAARVVAPRPWFDVPLARALAVLPWSVEGDPDVHPERGVALIVDLVGALPTRGAWRDADVVQGSMRALEGLLDRNPVLAAPVAARARAVARPWLEDARAEPGVRVAALGVWRRVAGPEDLDPLLGVLDDPDAPTELRFRAVGAVEALARAWSGGGDAEATQRVVAALDRVLDDPDPVLRRRALEALSDPALSSLAAAVGIEHWVRRVGEEPEDDVLLGLLALLRRHGTAAEVRPLLESPAFERFVRGDDGRAASSAETLVELADGSGRLLVDVADALASVDDPPSRAERLRGALAAVARLSDEMAHQLDPAHHRRAVAWALELRQAGVELPATAAGGGLFLRRLVDVHLEACLAEAGPDQGPCVHAHALLGADLAAAEGSLEPEAVEALFDAALAWAADHPGAVSEAEVVRDRARFRSLLGRDADALQDYERVLALERAADGGGRSALDVRDLRRAAGLADAAGAPDRACAFAWELVGHPAWGERPDAERATDVEDLARRVAALPDPGAEQARLARWLDAGLELTSPEARDRIADLRAGLAADAGEPREAGAQGGSDGR